MPDNDKDNFVSFVQGHGAQYSSMPAGKVGGARQRPLSTHALAFARERAAAQLAFQRETEKQSANR